ncbi:MAG: OsmC family peroxiredoxin, partial [Promethearchaeota archaeon]
MKVRINYSENLHFIASARTFENLHIDEPESFHGTDLGPSAVEYFLIGIGGCLGSTFTYCLQKKQIEIENLEIVIDGQLKHSEPKLRLQLVNVEVEIFYVLKPGYSKEKLEQCLKIYQEYCVISNSIHKG